MTHKIFVFLLLLFVSQIEAKAYSSSESADSEASSISSEENGTELEGLKIGNVSDTDSIIHDQSLDKSRKLEIINTTIYDSFDNDTARELALEKYEKAIQLDSYAQEYVEADEKIKNITEQIENLVSTETFKKMSEDEQKEELDKLTASLSDDDLEKIEDFENVMQGHIVELGLDSEEEYNGTVFGVDTFGAQGI